MHECIQILRQLKMVRQHRLVLGHFIYFNRGGKKLIDNRRNKAEIFSLTLW